MKITNIYAALLLLSIISIGTLSAQQDPNYTFYRYNMNLINPAFAGASGGTDIGLNVRSQWAGIEGAPETQSLVFGTPAGKNVGLGVSIVNDKTFIETQTSISADFSYKLALSEDTDLYLGLKGGFTSYDVNTQGLVTYGIQQDMSLMDIDGRFTPNFGAGAYLKHESYFISFSVPKILTPKRLERNDGEARLGADKVHLYLAGGYDFPLNENLVLKPSTLLKYVSTSPLSFDLTTLLEIKEKFGLGAAYRLSESVSGLFIYKLNWVDLGYAYEIPLESQVRDGGGTHEIMMHLKF
ncbi:type IX secretion system membrane protein PorP/SprF [Pricia sp. S334]|uniref:Type IX secretion system membrane protein PorP/SprF n=1 Tax=Pricia mediterranea TaxID=3076079 RepID=A0ABU3L804_9FLAO|nr:type IX secretion system membrane protein PorP/SprF [Pricia sp. S334]MDT7829498.1 type IX secretion system membrane protein PorP/SprF [Pricia sp. S334]